MVLAAVEGVAASENPLATSTPQRYLTPAVVKQLQITMQQEIQNNLALVGLGKTGGAPPTYSDALWSYRNSWAKIDPEIAPFLGHWVWNWDIFPPNYSLTIFPSRVKGQVCMIAQDTAYVDADPVPTEVVLPPQFSTAQISRGRGAGDRWRLDRTLIMRVKNGVPGQIVEFLTIVNRQNQHQMYASQSIPKLSPLLPAEIIKQFNVNQCLL